MRISDWSSDVCSSDLWVGTDTNGRHQSDDRFSGRVGVTYLFDNGFAPYASWGQSFEVVSGTEAPERGGKAFEPSTGEQVEVGVKYQPSNGNMLLTLAAYKIAQDERPPCGRHKAQRHAIRQAPFAGLVELRDDGQR